MSQPNEEFMREAIRLSVEKMEEGFGGPFGAVIVKDGEIIARGFNQVLATHDPTAHAEVTAIREACRALQTHVLEGCEIYTSAEPCPMCMASIYWARLSTCYYGNTKEDTAAIGFDDRFIYEEFNKPFAQRSINMQQLMRDEANVAFRIWTEREDKTMY